MLRVRVRNFKGFTFPVILGKEMEAMRNGTVEAEAPKGNYAN